MRGVSDCLERAQPPAPGAVMATVLDLLLEHPARVIAAAAAVTLLAAAALIAIPPILDAQLVEVTDV